MNERLKTQNAHPIQDASYFQMLCHQIRNNLMPVADLKLQQTQASRQMFRAHKLVQRSSLNISLDIFHPFTNSECSIKTLIDKLFQSCNNEPIQPHRAIFPTGFFPDERSIKVTRTSSHEIINRLNETSPSE